MPPILWVMLGFTLDVYFVGLGIISCICHCGIWFPKSLRSSDLFHFFIVLPSLGCLVVGIIQTVGTLFRLLIFLNNIQLRL